MHVILALDNDVRELLTGHANVVAEIADGLGAWANNRLDNRRAYVPSRRTNDSPQSQKRLKAPNMLKKIFFVLLFMPQTISNFLFFSYKKI